MNKLFVFIFLIIGLAYSNFSAAQVDSAKLLKAQKQIENNKDDVDKMNRKIAKDQRKIKKRERKAAKKEKARNRQLTRIKKQERELEKIKKDTTF